MVDCMQLANIGDIATRMTIDSDNLLNYSLTGIPLVVTTTEHNQRIAKDFVVTTDTYHVTTKGFAERT
jgi:hypothetical protein